MNGFILLIASLQCFCAIAEFNYEVGLRVRERVAEFLGKVRRKQNGHDHSLLCNTFHLILFFCTAAKKYSRNVIPLSKQWNIST